MHLFTFNSNFSNVSLVPRVLILTTLLLGVYWSVIQLLDWDVTVAETNSNSGLLRLQSLADSNSSSAIIVGSSIIAKLDEKVIFNQFNGDLINMGLDGGSTIFAMKKILESNTSPKKILLEVNRILVVPNENMEILDNITNSVIFEMSEFLPIFRREYRPVTYLYSKLKIMKDKNNYKYQLIIGNRGALTIPVEYPFSKIIYHHNKTDIEKQWENIITEFQRNKVSIILVMIPDSRNNRDKEYMFSRRLASKYNLPLIDLKKHLNNSFTYTDSVHLSYSSAKEVSKLLNIILLNIK